MICPVCDAEVYDLDAESCSGCETALASWKACDRGLHARPLLRCCRCGECPSPGDRACRQCQAHFLKRVPAWLDAEFPGWFDPNEDDLASTLRCTSCDIEVSPGRAKCKICGLSFHKPAKISAIKQWEMALAHQSDDVPDDDVPWFTGANPPQAIAHDAAPVLIADAPERILNTKPETVQSLPAPTPSKSVSPSISVVVKPTVVPFVASARKARTKGEEIAAVIAARITSPKAKLLAERQASYKALLASGIIRPMPGVKRLSSQSVVCANGHRSNFGLFACQPDYGTLDSLPDFKPVNWQDRLAAAFQVRGGTVQDDINDRDPSHDVRWSLGCPWCGTDQYTFEAAPLRDYAMCTASADYWWVFCHLYRRDSGSCGNCEIRRVYWDGLRSLE